jgi:diguanylate cyclase (GGDEF)-like protein/PAS domain S-box-containing protein
MAAVLVDRTGTAIAANEWADELLGYEPGGLVGVNAFDIVHPRDFERARTNLATAVAGDFPAGIRMAVCVRRPDGSTVDLLAVAVNLLEEDGFGGILLSLRAANPESINDPRRRGWFEAVVSGTDDIVQVIDEEGRILWASGPVEEMLGIPAEALVGLTIFQMRHERDPDATRLWFERVKAETSGEPVVVQARRDLTGGEFDLEIRAHNLLDDPEVRAVVMTTRDITDRVSAEHARRFAADLVDRAPVAFITTDDRGVITSFNPEAERITGYPAASVVGHRFRDIGGHTQESLDIILDGLEQIRRGGTIEFESEIHDVHGQLVPVYLGVTGMLDADGDYTGNMIFGLDLREQTRVRKALANTERHWLTLSKHAHELVALVDPKGIVQWTGSSVQSLLGVNSEDLVGRDIGELAHPDDRERWGNLITLARETGEEHHREYRVQNADGDWRVFDVRVTDLRDEPSVGCFLVTGRDVTDRVEAEERNRRMAGAMESAGAAVILTDATGHVLSWNREAERISGVPAGAVLGQRILQGNPLSETDRAALRESLLAGATVTYESEFRASDGSKRSLSITASPVTDAVGEVNGFSFIGFDVTAQREAAIEREARAAQSRALAELGQRALSGLSVPEVLEDACELAAAALGIPHVHVLLLSNDGRHHEVAAAVGLLRNHSATLDAGGPAGWTAAMLDHSRPVVVADFEVEGAQQPHQSAAGSVRSGVLCAIDGSAGRIGFLAALDDRVRQYQEAEVAFLQSIANVLAAAIDRARVADEMQRRAHHDELTGLPNRALLVDRLARAVGRLDRRSGTVGLLFIDLDRFKRVNDTLGHSAGDDLLVATARRLLDAVRQGDTVARTGGDEFLVLTEEITDPEGAVVLAQRVANALTEPVFVDGHGIHVTASIGVAVADASTDPEELIRDADLAMYRAKQEGRDRIQVFDASMRDDAVAGMAIEEALRVAVAAADVRVVYQPQVDMVDGRVLGIEALARWEHPRLGEVPPTAFVAIAEEIGVLDDITRLVLAAACDTTAALRLRHPHLSAAVNLTPRQLSRRQIIDLIAEALDATSLPPTALVVEVTESAALDDTTSLKVLGELRERGIRVSIDDFGTGYSSLARVTHLPVDEVKIDRTFVDGVAEDRGRAAAVSAIVTLSRVLGLRLVGEGVETELQRRSLLELGCTEGQGWLFSGPLARDELIAWIDG